MMRESSRVAALSKHERHANDMWEPVLDVTLPSLIRLDPGRPIDL
jgi:hypothetical protein